MESGSTRQIMYGFLLVFFSNFVPKTHRFFLDIRLQEYHHSMEHTRLPIDVM